MKKRILSTLLVLCMVLALLPGTAWAVETHSGTCGDNITWRISGDGTLFLDGKGNTPYFGWYYFAEPAPWEEYADSIKTIHVNEGITGINGGAFSGCNSATGIVLPASLQFIGSGAWPTSDKLMYVVTGFNSTNYIEYGGVLYAKNPATSESEVGKGVPSLVCGAETFRRCRTIRMVRLYLFLLSFRREKVIPLLAGRMVLKRISPEMVSLFRTGTWC